MNKIFFLEQLKYKHICTKGLSLSLYICNLMSQTLDISSFESVGSNHLILKHLRFTPSGCKDIKIRKYKFVAKYNFFTNYEIINIWQFFYLKPSFLGYDWSLLTDIPPGRNPCATSLCENGGLCLPLLNPTPEQTTTCSCVAGFTGPTCSAPASSCSENPCSHAGACLEDSVSGRELVLEIHFQPFILFCQPLLSFIIILSLPFIYLCHLFIIFMTSIYPYMP